MGFHITLATLNLKVMRFLIILLLCSNAILAQELPVRWDELTASDWSEALERSARTCILPIGILEKHGLHAPIGSDMIHARAWSIGAAKKEYAVVFPDYFYGQVYEAKQQPGTFALPSKLVWELLQATCDEIARNGFEKIVIVNGHGGNPNLLKYFVQAQLEKKRDYAVFFFDPVQDPEFAKEVAQIRKSDPAGDMHAGERETSTLLYLRPDLVKPDRAKNESGENLKRLALPNLYTGIWWYANFPNHYAGEGYKATAELGRLLTENKVESLITALRAVKNDTKTLELQEEYFQRVDQLFKND
jgi:creatinine amidohydrolase